MFEEKGGNVQAPLLVFYTLRVILESLRLSSSSRTLGVTATGVYQYGTCVHGTPTSGAQWGPLNLNFTSYTFLGAQLMTTTNPPWD